MTDFSDLSPQEATIALGEHGRHVRTAHGFIMAIVFIGLKPGGAILLRVLKGRVAFQVHVVWQMFAWIVAFSGVGLGIWLARTMNRFGKQHPIIGFVVVGAMLVQPFLGWAHHIIFMRTKKPAWLGTLHTWLGRLIIMLGIINGGLGLGDANNTRAGLIVYSVLAGVSFLAYVAIMVILSLRERS